MYSADDFVLHNPQRLEDICFLVTYRSIINDLDFAFELQTRRKTEKFRHSILLPHICTTVTPDFVKETIKQRFSQLKGMVSVDFRRKFLKQALADRSMDHIEEVILFDVCLGEDFDEFELHIPIEVASQTRMDVVNKLRLVPNVQDLTIKVGRDFDDPSEAKVLSGNDQKCCCSICLSVDRALHIASSFTYLRSFRFVGVGLKFTEFPTTLLQHFGKNCHFLEVFHMLDTVFFCEDLLYLICKDPVKLLSGGLDESSLNQEEESMWPCYATLKDVRIYETLHGNLRWGRQQVGVFLLRNVPNLQLLRLDKSDTKPYFVEYKILHELEPFLVSPIKPFCLKKIDMPLMVPSKQWIHICKKWFPSLEAVQIIGSSNLHLFSGSEQVELVPQVKEVSLIAGSGRTVPEPAAILYFCSLFASMETLQSDFVFADFEILDKLEKLKCLSLSVRDCQNDERTSIQRTFVPSRTYGLTQFLCSNVCLGPEVARQIVKNSPFLTHIHLQCIHGAGLPKLELSKNLAEFQISSYDDHYSVDTYIDFVVKYKHLTKASFPARVANCDYEAMPKLRKLHAFCTSHGIDLQFVAYSCNRFWDEREFELPSDESPAGSDSEDGEDFDDGDYYDLTDVDIEDEEYDQDLVDYDLL